MAMRFPTQTTAIAFAAVAMTTMTITSSPAKAGTDAYVGEIMMVGFNFCPRGWAEASGQALQIDRYQELFSLIGTTYGGDGTTTFALPDLRGRVPMHAGLGLGLSPRPLGHAGGQERVADVDPSEPSAAVTPPFLSVFFCINLDGKFPHR
jgi:microcystin-dependent protein